MSDYDNMREELMIKEIESLREANKFHQQTEKDYRGEIAKLKDYKLKWQKLLEDDNKEKDEYETYSINNYQLACDTIRKSKILQKKMSVQEEMYLKLEKKFISYKKRIKKERVVWKEELNGKNGKK